MIFPRFIRTVVVFFVIFGLFPGYAALAKDKADPTLYQPLQQRLIADGFDAGRINQLYRQPKVFFETRGVTQYFMHNEATLNYKKFTKNRYINDARRYMKLHHESLQRAKTEFGVAPEVITAIILVETKFGRYLGSKSILNTLSTMAALTNTAAREYLWGKIPKGRRITRRQFEAKADQKAEWAYKELKAFLTYTARHDIDPATVIGSYAGALGIAQFMPSNILAFGRDGNADGRIDLFDDADAILSIASYLKHYGWRAGLGRDQAFKVVYHYNHSKYYVNTILDIAKLLES